MNLRPLHDRVIVKRQEKETTTAGGIVLASSAAEKPSEGVVVAVGPGKANKNGDVRPLEVKVGDRVLFGKFTGSEVKVDGEDYVIMREEEIFAVIQ
ncbi:co-chaperone GroES [uncultured Cardiobacterium sp.]|uniref:co-chaperone GroES n=1 Tax=uncultured Cardiobacterium sp. TaxID=417619 RepID=UPI00262CBD58|nr:co-chaperone GroES [uncultured Cardiobacterium sp.]